MLLVSDHLILGFCSVLPQERQDLLPGMRIYHEGHQWDAAAVVAALAKVAARVTWLLWPARFRF